MSGYPTSVKRLLKRVSAYSGQNIYREYHLDYAYDTATRYEKLSKLTECGADGACLKPTSFAWTAVNPNFSATQSINLGTLAWNGVQIADMNGDSLMDLLIPINNAWWVAFNNGAGFNAAIPTNIANPEYASSFVVDINADGVHELMLARDNVWNILSYNLVTKTFQLKPLSGFSNVGWNYSPKPMDVNGDGLTDLLLAYNNQMHLHINQAGQLGSVININIDNRFMANSFPFDMDGDGRSELLMPKDGHWYIVRYYSDTDIRLELAGTDNRGWDARPQVLDVNGDGLQDLVVAYDGKWWLRVNDGKRLKPAVVAFSSVGAALDKAQVIDYDDDGLSDLIYPKNNLWYVARSRGEIGFEEISTGYSSANQATFRVLDVDNDGFSDLLYNDNTSWKALKRGNGVLPGYMTDVVNGLGYTTSFQYGLLTKAWLYTPGAVRSYPLQRALGPINAVWRVYTSSKGVNNLGPLKSNFVNYHYEDLVFHTAGLGSLGYKKITTTNHLGEKVETTYSQDYINRLSGTPLEVKSYVGGKLASHRFLSSKRTFRSASNNKVYSTYTYQEKELEYEIDGSLIKQTTSNYTPDIASSPYPTSAVNNMLATSVETVAPNGQKLTVTTSSQYAQDNLSSWLVGRPTSAQVVYSGTGRPTVTKKSQWTYSTTTGAIVQETIEPGNAALRVDKVYGYNSQGLTTSVTTSAAGLPSRTTHTQYDALGRYAVSQTNVLGQSVHFTFDPVLVLVTQATDPNGLSVTTSYDGFGRETKVSKSDGTFQRIEYLPASGVATRVLSLLNDKPFYSLSLPATYYVKRTDQNGRQALTYYDVAGDEIRQQTLGFDGRWVSVDKEYTFKGDVLRISEPYRAGEPQFWTTTAALDAFRRPIRVINQAGGISQTLYGPLSETLINEKGQQTVTRYTLDGKRQSVTDAMGSLVTYEYDATGNMIGMVNGASGTHTSISLNVRGQKVAMSDPDKGTWTYTYNAFDELAMQTDANGTRICNAYDLGGRLIKRIDNYQGSPAQALSGCAGDDGNPQITRWTYDTAANGIGALASVSGPDGFQESYVYDSLSRPIRKTRQIDGQSYTTTTSYDSQSRPLSATYPSGLKVHNHYNALGFLAEIRQPNDQDYYWKLEQVDARGNAVVERFASGVLDISKGYTADRGLIESIVATSFGAATGDLQFNFASYDELGNVTNRQDARLNQVENFAFDGLNRLTTVSASINGQAASTKQNSYFANGNIQTRSDVAGIYQYGGSCNGVTAGPHAVTSAGGQSYCYDKNGNMLSGAGRTIEWTAAGMPSRFIKGTTQVAFTYGPSRERVMRVDVTAQKTKKTIYDGAYERVESLAGGVATLEERHTIGGFALITVKDGDLAHPKTNYMLKDNLGSVVGYLDPAKLGTSSDPVERLAFDPWGQRRNTNSFTLLTITELLAFQSPTSERGFTGHEHIDAVGLIHMNGRVYDPLLGRFISADPIIQDPTDSQSLNRYSYVRNNPVSLIDPSGFSFLGKVWKKFKDAFIATVGFNFTLYLAKVSIREVGRLAAKNKYVVAALQIAACALNCVIGPAVVTYGVTGDFNAALKVGAIAFVQAIGAGYIGNTFGDPSLFTVTGAKSVAAHALLGGAASVARGGDFKSGALSAGLSKASILGLSKGGVFAAAHVDSASSFDKAIRTTIAAAVGGATARATGGDPLIGAVGAAIQHLNNFERSNSALKQCGSGPVTCVANGSGGATAPSDHPRWPGQGYTDDGRKIALYSCSNDGGSCSFYAPSNSENVLGAVMRTTVSPSGDLTDYAIRLDSFEVDPQPRLLEKVFSIEPSDFIQELRKNQKNN